MQVSTGPQLRLVPGKISPVPKAYIVARINVADPDGYEEYVNGAVKVTNGAGGTLLVSGGRSEPIEGKLHNRIIVIEFESMEAARAAAAGYSALRATHGSSAPRIQFGHRPRRIELGAPASM